MKVKNDFIKIKIGKKEYDFKNLIFDNYLKRIAYRHLTGNDNIIQGSFELNHISLKFDEPFENVNPSSEISVNDMDIFSLDFVDVRLKASENKIQIQYAFNLKYDITAYYGKINYDTGSIESFYGLSEYKGRKIAALGFQIWFYSAGTWNLKLCAYLDLSDQNIYIQENQDILIVRQDSFYTDAKFYSSDKKLNYPLHLSPISTVEFFEPIYFVQEETEDIITWEHCQADKSHFVLYSVGFSNSIDKIEKEFIIGEDVEGIQENNKIIFKNIENKYLNRLIQPSLNIFPNVNLYPLQEKFKYIIYKYRLIEGKLTGEIQYDEELQEYFHIEEDTYTGVYYLQAKEIELPINKNIDLIISYDRI